MSDSNDRPELERRLNQARRMADQALDSVTKERIEKLIRDLEDLLRPLN
jgi:predicted DNA-binding protein